MKILHPKSNDVVGDPKLVQVYWLQRQRVQRWQLLVGGADRSSISTTSHNGRWQTAFETKSGEEKDRKDKYNDKTQIKTNVNNQNTTGGGRPPLRPSQVRKAAKDKNNVKKNTGGDRLPLRPSQVRVYWESCQECVEQEKTEAKIKEETQSKAEIKTKLDTNTKTTQKTMRHCLREKERETWRSAAGRHWVE